MDPSQRNRSLRCNYHRDHGHETDKCQSLKFLVEKFIKVGHLKRYIREIDQGSEPRQDANRIVVGAVALLEPRLAINCILGSPSNDQYQSKLQQKKLLRAATIKAMVNAIHTRSNRVEPEPIDGPISFPLVNPNRVIMPHYDVLVLTLCINDFNVHRVLVDLGSTTYLLQQSAFKKMKLSLEMLNSAGRILSSFNGATTVTLGDVSHSL